MHLGLMSKPLHVSEYVREKKVNTAVLSTLGVQAGGPLSSHGLRSSLCFNHLELV